MRSGKGAGFMGDVARHSLYTTLLKRTRVIRPDVAKGEGAVCSGAGLHCSCSTRPDSVESKARGQVESSNWIEAVIMDAKQVVPGLWEVRIKFVNAFLLDTGDGLALIDTGIPGSVPVIQEALHSIGRQPADIRHILITHCHSDHCGSLAEMKRLTGAPATMHPLDAAMVREGRAIRPLTPAPGLLNALVCRFLLPGAPKE